MDRYEAFLKVTECGSFTRAAQELRYTQSAVSQMVRALEQELGSPLLLRSKSGVQLTADGRAYLPYLRAVAMARRELEAKRAELQGLAGGVVRIGTFTSVSRNWLPWLMKEFKALYPSVQFELQQGEYTNIGQWVREGSVDFGFVNPEAVAGLAIVPLRRDAMQAILPPGHPLAAQPTVALAQLAAQPCILLDEGELSVPMNAFRAQGLTPNIQYKVFDDYTIMSMVEQGLGVSVLYGLVLQNSPGRFVARPLAERVERTIALACRDRKALPVASRRFFDFIRQKLALDAPA